MSKEKIKNKKAFTLLEIMLAIILIGILISIALVSINPNRQLSQARNTERVAEVNRLYDAIERYMSDNGLYPFDIDFTEKTICNTGSKSSTDTLSPSNLCEGKADLRVLVPKYIDSIPTDPAGSLYKVRINSNNNEVSLLAPDAELNEDVSINKVSFAWAEGGNNIYTLQSGSRSYRVHEFNVAGTSTINFTKAGLVEYLIVGGGGGSGVVADVYSIPGGGGQVVSGTINVLAQSYSVVVGKGGSSKGTVANPEVGENGVESSVFSIIANPGQGGGRQVGKGGLSGSGKEGGNHQGCGSGGGGGAGGVGGGAVPSCGDNGQGGLGGIGIQSDITGVMLGYGGGGGGESWNQGCRPGSDGGGKCKWGVGFVAGTEVLPSRGGGAGSEQNGGSGVVIIRYEI